MQKKTEDTRMLKTKAIDSFFVLAIRRILMQAVQTASSILLARLLFPDVFGLYALVLFFQGIFLLLTDIGLYMSIIQDKKEPTLLELRGIFTVHVSLGIISSIIFWFLVPVLFYLFNHPLDKAHLFVVQMSSLALIFYNLKLVPQALLERAINFKRIAIAEVSEILVFNIGTIYLAFNGFGVASFIWGLILSRFTTVITLFILRSWRIGFSLNLAHLKRFLSFGVPFQASAVYGTMSGAVAPVVVGGMLGVNALGLVNWAGGVAGLPRVISEIISRILLPLGARSQNDPEILKKTIERTMHLSSVISFPLIALVFVLAKPITYIVFTDKWLPGLGTLYIFCIYGVFAILQDILVHALWAVGYSKTVRDITLLSVVLQWTFSFVLVSKLGLIGFSIAWLLTGVNCVLLYLALRKKVKINVISDLLKTLALSVLTGLAVFSVTLFFPVTSIWYLMGIGSAGLSVYALSFFYFRKKVWVQDVQLVRELVVHRILRKKLGTKFN